MTIQRLVTVLLLVGLMTVAGCASTPPRRCLRQPGLSATITDAPVCWMSRSLRPMMRAATSGCSSEKEPPKPQQKLGSVISRSSSPSTSHSSRRGSAFRFRQLWLWQASW